ncbi:hypothetical protein [Nonomuraea diastatica]|nr:hypothetical protein [Nonomuraea diastatica]
MGTSVAISVEQCDLCPRPARSFPAWIKDGKRQQVLEAKRDEALATR